MKKLMLIVSLFLSVKIVTAQNATQTLERDFLIYSKLITEKKIENALDYLNPKLFEIFPKEGMKKLMEAVYNMPNIQYKISIPQILEIGDFRKINNIYYSKFKVLSFIEMRFEGVEKDENTISAMIASFEAKFGKGNVQYDKSTEFFKINATKEIVASSTDNQKNWKFITVDNAKMKMLIEKIIPKEILD